MLQFKAAAIAAHTRLGLTAFDVGIEIVKGTFAEYG
jgi:hypothetical protein